MGKNITWTKDFLKEMQILVDRYEKELEDLMENFDKRVGRGDRETITTKKEIVNNINRKFKVAAIKILDRYF